MQMVSHQNEYACEQQDHHWYYTDKNTEYMQTVSHQNEHASHVWKDYSSNYIDKDSEYNDIFSHLCE